MGHALRRVAVLGSPGSGKSTLAVDLARRTGLPYVDLDALFWRPGWVQPPEQEWRAVQRRLVAEPRWVLDGNYASTYDERLPFADLVVVLDTGRWRCLQRVLLRRIRRRGGEVAPGCPEQVDLEFVRYIWRFERRVGGRLDEALAALPAGARLERLRTRDDVSRFLAAL